MPLDMENKLYEQLSNLRDNYDIYAVKAEFEAEGSGFRDLMRLRRISSALGVELHIKIGGVEAVRDMLDCAELAVDGIIAPMVESAFGARKYVQMIDKLRMRGRFHFSINIETQSGIKDLDDILSEIKGAISNVTVGRSDLSGSYMNPDIGPNSDFTADRVTEVAEKVVPAGFDMTMGGTINSRAIEIVKERPAIRDALTRVETRKIIMPVKAFVEKENILEEIFLFEELYILSKKAFSDMKLESELSRLTSLKTRLS